MLLARRLVEAEVPFVTVFWKEDKELDKLCKSGGGWDTHGNNFNCLKDRSRPVTLLMATPSLSSRPIVTPRLHSAECPK